MPRVRIIWSPSALLGIQRAYRFLAEKDLDAAKTMAALLFKYAEQLEKFPYSGRPSDDLDPEHRELIIPFGGAGYILLYEVIDDNIHILAVRHQKEAGY